VRDTLKCIGLKVQLIGNGVLIGYINLWQLTRWKIDSYFLDSDTGASTDIDDTFGIPKRSIIVSE
jgi:hypothetical protein